MWTDKPHKSGYDISVVIGRFQPLHNGHVDLIRYAKDVAKNTLVLVGSSDLPSSFKNPFSSSTRIAWIEKTIPNIEVDSIVDYSYNDNLWFAQVHEKVNEYARFLGLENPKICLVGYKKDKSSWYLDKFPSWDYEEFYEAHNGISGTAIRTCLFNSSLDPVESSKDFKLPEVVLKYIKDHYNTQEFKIICEEFEFIDKYKSQWSESPYPVIFQTTDNVVICNGHVLVVKRKACPGKGLYAMPGGFLNYWERIVDGMIRELKEETSIKLSTNLLKSSIKSIHYFDNPDRSLRGRTITHAGLIVLNMPKLPEVKGDDDAEKAFWIPIGEFYGMRSKFFEDHYDIITHMINKAG